jgi:hypothetical protein
MQFASTAVEPGYRGADYDFITAETQQEKSRDFIKYTLDTKRARSEVRAQKTQGHHATWSPLPLTLKTRIDRSPHLFAFGPLEMEAVLAGTGEMQTELEPETAESVELLDTDEGDDRTDARGLGHRTAAPQPCLQDYRVQVTDASIEASILAIGEPACPKKYPRLFAYAKRRWPLKSLPTLTGWANQRSKVFSDDSRNVGPDAREVINTLLERPWRIAHIAGHGDLTAEGKTGGVVLSNGAFLGPDEIATMRAVPELVFVNCCHLAARDIDQLLAEGTRQSYDRPRFASGVAEQLIKIGVKCVIAAGWAVDDMSARTFATTFYTSLLSGNRFVDAVAAAREAAYAEGGNTWAAYQC